MICCPCPFSPLLPLILLLFLAQILSLAFHADSFKVNANLHPNRTLLVLAAPSIWDLNYADDFVPIVEFQIRLVRLLNEYESAILIVDRHTIPFVNGQRELLSDHLPAELLLEASLYDINVHDFAPLGNVRRVKFVYRNDNWTSVASKQTDDSINRLLSKSRVRVDKRETDIVLMGKDVVDNGVNRALLSNITFGQNARRMGKQSLLIKMQNAFRKVIVVPPPVPSPGCHRFRLDDVLSFIDENVLVMSPLSPTIGDRVHMELFKREKKGITVIELPISGTEDKERRQLNNKNADESTDKNPFQSDEGNCGLYSAILTTDRFVFVPVFGNNPANWKLGYSTMRDKWMVRLIDTYTRKTVVPVNVPREICRRGLSLRSLSWTLKGAAAKAIVGLISSRTRLKERENVSEPVNY